MVSLASGCSGEPATEQTTGEPIKLGVFVPLSGPAAATGQEMRNAYLLAETEINASGGVLGRPIELVIEDSKDPAAAVASMERLVTKDGIEILLGGVSSTVAYALAEPTKKYEPLMAWTGAASSLVEQAFGDVDWFFHYHPWEYHNVQALVDFLTHAGATKVAIAYEDGLFGTSNIKIAEEMFPEAGLELLLAEPFKSGTGDFAPLLTRIENADPDAFVWIGYPGDAIPITTQAKELDFNPDTILAYVPGWPEGWAELDVSEYVTAIVLSTPDVPNEAAQGFVAAYKAEYGSAPLSYWGPLAYTSLVTVADAIEKAGTTEKAAVIEALAETEYDSPLGSTLTFTPSRIAKHQGFKNLVTVQWRSSKMEVVYPTELATKELVYPAPSWGDR